MKVEVRHRLLGQWARLVSRHPKAVLGSAAVLVAFSLALVFGLLRPVGVPALGFQSNRNDLISKSLPWNQRFIDWQENFPGSTDLVVVVDAGDEQGRVTPERSQGARRIIDQLSELLKPEKDEHVEWAVWGAYFSPRSIRLGSLTQVRQEAQRITEAGTLLGSASAAALIDQVTTEFRKGEDQTEEEALVGLRELGSVIMQMGRTLVDPEHRFNLDPAAVSGPATVKPDNAAAALGEWNYFTSDNGRLYFIRVTPRADPAALNALAAAISNIRGIINKVNAEHPQFDVGITGIEVVEADETDAATWDGTWTSILAAVLITALLCLAFQSFRTPFLAMLALLFGVAWAFGFATLVVGHLQVISVIFTVMLLGLGIAYGIFIASRFELVRHNYPDTPEGFEDAIADTLQTMGPGIFTGAITTAAAFMTTLLTDFKGVAEMGLIAGGGVLICFVSMISVFPALLRLFKPYHRHIPPMHSRWVHFYEERWSLPFSRHPWIVAIAALAVTAASLVAVSKMRFDYDLLKLQPEGVESVEWAHRIVRDGGESIWSGVSIVNETVQGAENPSASTLAEIKKRKRQFMLKSTVSTVRGIGFLDPDMNDEKVAVLKLAREKIEGPLSQALSQPVGVANQESPPDVLGSMGRLKTLLSAALLFRSGDIPPSIQDEMNGLIALISQITGQVQALPGDERQAAARRLHEQYLAYRTRTAQRIDLMLDTAPMTLADLPRDLMLPYVGKDEAGRPRYVMEVYPELPKGPRAAMEGPLSPHFLPQFIYDMRQVDPKVTGVIVQIFESGDLIWRSYLWAGGYALVVVFVLVLIDFRRIYDSALCLLPVAIGFAATFGLMWAVGIQINPANIIVLPLMFGIGVDAGVHMLHRYRMDSKDRPLGLTQGTGKGITITSLTTMIGFGCLSLASHRGIQSLGHTLTAGIGLTMLACLIVMPAWLELRQRRIERKAGKL
ncbi:MAG: MMPL family transporter [Phycisphaeraceae bacterium]